jgi:hypothetical protein
MQHHHYGAIEQIHIVLALIIMGAYVAVPLTSMRRLKLTRQARYSAIGFFATCAITHLSVAAGFHDNPWMTLNDAVQAASTIVFIASVSRMVDHVISRRKAPEPEEG